MEALAAEKSKKQPIYAGTLIGSSSLDFEDAGEEERLFYDAISGGIFRLPSARCSRPNTTSTGTLPWAEVSSP